MDKAFIEEYTAILKKIFENSLYLESRSREITERCEKISDLVDKALARMELLNDKL